jgi:hypothetical protein
MITLCVAIVLIATLSIVIAKQRSELIKLDARYDSANHHRKELDAALGRSTDEVKTLKRLLQNAEQDDKNRCETIRGLREELRELRQTIKERHAIHGIKFVANVPMKGWTPTEFKLGLGKCGLEVASLVWEEKSDRYVLTQRHTDGSRKVFEYKKEDVQGRIEVFYPAVK